MPEPPAGLPSADGKALNHKLEAALQTQSEQLDEALENVFEHIPWLLRGPVRRLAGT